MELSQSQRLKRREEVEQWFRLLRDRLCYALESVEASLPKQSYSSLPMQLYAPSDGLDEPPPSNAQGQPRRFRRKRWQRQNVHAAVQAKDEQSDVGTGGGGEMSLMRGRVFEKVGVNISTVYGTFVPELRREVKGAAKDGCFWASGISLVAHPLSPLVPAAHFNTRYIESAHGWFGGGGDLTPNSPDPAARKMFHAEFRRVCDKYEAGRYRAYAKACDEYFYIRHRRCARGAGGIFYDNLSDDWQRDFAFTREVGEAFLRIFPQIVRERFAESWSSQQRAQQLRVRGYYTEFNLVYDRGTRFGLLTDGNPEAVLMSLPPLAAW